MKIGLKLWSNNEHYLRPARDLFNERWFDYVEMFVVPGTRNAAAWWQELKVPYVLHAPHSHAGLNPARAELRHANREALAEVDAYVRSLDPAQVIFHPGTDGSEEEAIRQFNAMRQDFAWMSRALIENKPALGMRGERCQGASPQQIAALQAATGLGFCLDLGHAICYSVAGAQPWQKVVQEFIALRPAMFHLSDGFYRPTDAHCHFGQGEFELKALVGMIPPGSRVTVETPKDHPQRLDDVCDDIRRLRAYAAV